MVANGQVVFLAISKNSLYRTKNGLFYILYCYKWFLPPYLFLIINIILC
ncbi:MAG: hypothetical protein JWQ54_762 [Mucilaginibacter sp.]|nr:hypothetical protein [Mucilaginibacter sp.]